MKTKIQNLFIALTIFVGTHQLAAQTTAFMYQGWLVSGGVPANGSYDLSFTLYNDGTNGTVFGALTNTATSVSNGLFTVALDFGSGIFAGSNYWLDVAVRTNGSATFTELTPRQPITPTPYAIYAPNAGSAATATTASIANSISAANIVGTVQLTQLPGTVLNNNQTGVTLAGTFTGNGAGLTSLNAAKLTGTVPPTSLPLSTNLLATPTIGTNLTVSFATNADGTVVMTLSGLSMGQLLTMIQSLGGLTNSEAVLTNTLFRVPTPPTGFSLSSDPIRVPNVPVAVLQPAGASNNAMVLDIWPSSSNGNGPTNTFDNSLVTKIDMVDRNLATLNPTNVWQALLFGIGTNNATIGTHSRGASPPVPITFWGPNTGAAFIFTTCSSNETSQTGIGSFGAGGFSWGNPSTVFSITPATGAYVRVGELGVHDAIPLAWYNSALGMSSTFASITATTNGNMTILTTNLLVSGTLTATNGFVSSQPSAATFNWSAIPSSSATHTNWWFGTFTNGGFYLIASNYVNGGYLYQRLDTTTSSSP